METIILADLFRKVPSISAEDIDIDTFCEFLLGAILVLGFW